MLFKQIKHAFEILSKGFDTGRVFKEFSIADFLNAFVRTAVFDVNVCVVNYHVSVTSECV